METIDIKVPLKNMPRHVLVTERFKEILKPLVIDWDTPGAPYIVQKKEGNFYMGVEVEEEPDQPLKVQRVDYMPKILRAIYRFFPWIINTRILRYWLGYYVTSPDNHPIYGPIKRYENLYIAAGFSGHGYMLGPITGKILSEWIILGRPTIRLAERLTIDRFEKGEIIKEIAVVG